MQIIERPSPHGGGVQRPQRGVVHAMGEYIRLDDGRVMEAAEFLEHLGLSAHCLVKPNGDRIRTRRPDQVAWHAKGHNSNTYGAEVLLPGTHDYASLIAGTRVPGWTTGMQMLALTEEFRWVAALYPEFDTGEIDRHSDLDPDRRWFDPGEGFPWDEFKARMAGAVG